jgi:hypothetical protein
VILRRILGRTVAWSTDAPELERQIEALTGLFPASQSPPDVVLALDTRGDAVTVGVDGVQVAEVDPSLALSVALERLILRLSRDATSCWVHAGVVEKGGRALLLPAMSRSGKSTLTAALLGVGFRFGSDELAPLDAEGRVEPYPVPIRMREDALGRLDPLPPGVTLWPGRMFRKHDWARFLLPAHACAPGPHPVGAILFLAGFRAGDTPELRGVSSGQTAVRLLAEQLGVDSPSARDFETCTALGERVPAYELVAVAPHATARWIAERWDAGDL